MKILACPANQIDNVSQRFHALNESIFLNTVISKYIFGLYFDKKQTTIAIKACCTTVPMTNAQYDLRRHANGTVTISGTNELPSLTKNNGLKSRSRLKRAITMLEKVRLQPQDFLPQPPTAYEKIE